MKDKNKRKIKIKETIKMDSYIINPIVDKIYDLRDENGYDDFHMLFACLLAAETIERIHKIDEKSKEKMRKEVERIGKKATFVPTYLPFEKDE